MAVLRFLLNGRAHEECRISPTTTVLDYLRLHLGMTGTKEGCAEGDCGACTIAISRHPGGKFEAVHSCLMVAPQLHGASVVTVEGLADADGGLHPVQQALVETDGTQCGFCTPGFAMAMFAFQQGGEPARDDLIHEALAGNLCRCTGYRPIVDACRSIAQTSNGQSFAPAPEVAACSDYGDGAARFLAPTTMDELAAILAAHPDAKLLAGGTDLGLLFSRERKSLPLLVSTAHIPELTRVTATADGLAIGAAASYSAALPHIETLYPSFSALIRRIGSRQIRNLGTIGGNIANASPIGDTILCLMALNATVAVRSVRGSRAIAMEDFITGYRTTALQPGEFIETIVLPKPKPGETFTAYKISKRFDQDISAVVAAFALRIEGGKLISIRAAYGGMAAQAGRAHALEAKLAGRSWTLDSLGDLETLLAENFTPADDHRASAHYRLSVAANLVRRLCLETNGAAPSALEAL